MRLSREIAGCFPNGCSPEKIEATQCRVRACPDRSHQFAARPSIRKQRGYRGVRACPDPTFMNPFQFERPQTRVVMRPKWRDLLFLHWQYDPTEIQKLLPAGLEVDCFQGRAYIGLVPFTMSDVRPHFVPDLGRVGHFYSRFPELNVRTYVVKNGIRGVWFFSLDAASIWATLAARVWFGLPYFKARMRLNRARNGDLRFASRRLWPNPKPAICQTRYHALGNARPAPEKSLEQFLVERYVLYSLKNGALFRGRVHHAPYQIERVELQNLRQNCVEAAGFSIPLGPPHALYSRGVDVEVFPLERV